MHFLRSSLCGVAVAMSIATTTGAQVTRIVGHVRDSSGTPIAATQVSSLGRRAVTDSAGRFALEGIPLGAVVINFRRLGFEPRDSNLTLTETPRDSMAVVLVAIPVELAGITSEASRLVLLDFYRHKGGGIGRFLDRAQIEAFHVQKASDIMRRMPGISLIPDRSGRYELRMRGQGGNCPPDFWIDGVRAPFLNVDDLPLDDIEALEIYNGPSGLPPEYLVRFGNPACGVVVIWTRLPG